MPTIVLAMEKMVSNILGVTLTVALGIVLVTSVTVISILAVNTTKGGATNATAADTTKGGSKLTQLELRRQKVGATNELELTL